MGDYKIEANRVNVTLKIDGKEIGGISGVSGLEYERDVQTYEEGGVNNWTWQLPGKISYSDITITRDYEYEKESAGKKRLVDFFLDKSEFGRVKRTTFDIQLYGMHEVSDSSSYRSQLATITVHGAIPKTYALGEFSNSSDKSSLEETLTLAHHGFTFVHIDAVADSSNYVSTIKKLDEDGDGKADSGKSEDQEKLDQANALKDQDDADKEEAKEKTAKMKEKVSDKLDEEDEKAKQKKDRKAKSTT